jgi:cholesterol oxidase
VRTGLFDVRVGNDVSALLASGLGGGSLINAGVMLAPHASVFQESRWPARIRADAADPAAWSALFAEARKMLGAAPVPAGPAPFAKLAALEALGRAAGPVATLVRPPITVALQAQRSTDGVALRACVECGDCATGCNHGAKESLDLNLLARAQRRGAQIYTGATVLKLVRCEGAFESLWQVHVVHTDDKLRRRAGGALVLRARKVILAAGTFGSAEILLRSETTGAHTPRLFSAKLGAQFSANGDMIEAAYGMNASAHCVATESQRLNSAMSGRPSPA